MAREARACSAPGLLLAVSHTGNWGKNPGKLALERARLAAHTAGDPPGFELSGDYWRGTSTPAGILIRGGILKGRCQTAECSRRVTADLEWWVIHGLGEASLHFDVQPAYQCSRIRCRFSFDPETYPHGLPFLLGLKKGGRIRITCGHCQRSTEIETTEFVRQIVKAGVGTATSSFVEIGRRLRRPCRGCGYAKWSVGAVKSG